MKKTYEVSVTTFPEGKAGIVITPGMKATLLHQALLPQVPLKTTCIVEDETKQNWIKEQTSDNKNSNFLFLSNPEDILAQLRDAKVQNGQKFAISLPGDTKEEEIVLIGTAQVKELGYLFSAIEYSFSLLKILHFVLLAEESKQLQDKTPLLIEDTNPQHLRERILSCRAWIQNGDSIDHVYQYYDVLKHAIQTMDHLQTFVGIDSADQVQIFQAKLRLKMNEWFGPIDFPTDASSRIAFRSEQNKE